MSKKILIIPHHPGLTNIKIRLIEIAKVLSRKYTIYLVNWKTVSGEYTMGARIFSAIRDILAKTRLYKHGTVNIVEFPILHRPLIFVPGFNYSRLKKIIEREKIDVLINGSYYMFSALKKRNFKYIFDIADLPVAETKTSFNRFVCKQTKTEIAKADAITVSSRGLVDYVLKNYQKEAFFIPNGADIKKLRSVNQVDVDKIRQRYNLKDKWVIGYIGNIGSWINIDLLIDVFKEVKKDISNAALFMVGCCPEVFKNKFLIEDVVFTGGVNSDEVSRYFSLIDLGILPSRKSLFQDLAFHIKVIEYTSARKFVVSAPLKEMELLNFPNFIFADEDKAAWVEAIKKARYGKWDKQWDNLVDDYDWSKIGQKFIDILG